jgi:hypothetical protein
MQDTLRREREAAGTTTFWVLIGVGQHHLVHVDVAVIGRQLLAFRLLTHLRQKLARPPKFLRHREDGVDAVRDRPDWALFEPEPEEGRPSCRRVRLLR